MIILMNVPIKKTINNSYNSSINNFINKPINETINNTINNTIKRSTDEMALIRSIRSCSTTNLVGLEARSLPDAPAL